MDEAETSHTQKHPSQEHALRIRLHYSIPALVEIPGSIMIDWLGSHVFLSIWWPIQWCNQVGRYLGSMAGLSTGWGKRVGSGIKRSQARCSATPVTVSPEHDTTAVPVPSKLRSYPSVICPSILLLISDPSSWDIFFAWMMPSHCFEIHFISLSPSRNTS